MADLGAAFLPVVLFLALLRLLDSFKLVSIRAVAQALLAGALAALAVTLLHRGLLETAGLSPRMLVRYLAPVTEEALKAAWVAWLLRAGRVGFLVDAAIQGFAVGTGFALVENAQYLRALPEGGPWLWIVRGCGTAVLHGATTAIVAVVARALSDRRGTSPVFAVAPGLAGAVLLHSFYNHFLLPPLLATALLLAVLPLLLVAVFHRSEAVTRGWLGVGLDTDLDLLDSIVSGGILETRVGAYLRSLQSRFPGPVVADMLCLLRIRLELSIRAKGLLLARELGFDLPPADDVRANLEELRYLQKAVGPTGLLALKPILRGSSRDLWQVYLLRETGHAAGGAG